MFDAILTDGGHFNLRLKVSSASGFIHSCDRGRELPQRREERLRFNDPLSRDLAKLEVVGHAEKPYDMQRGGEALSGTVEVDLTTDAETAVPPAE